MQDRKEQILERIHRAAADVLLHRGYAKTTIKAVAEAADLPVGLIYAYYKDREGLLSHVCEKNPHIGPLCKQKGDSPPQEPTYPGKVAYENLR